MRHVACRLAKPSPNPNSIELSSDFHLVRSLKLCQFQHFQIYWKTSKLPGRLAGRQAVRQSDLLLCGCCKWFASIFQTHLMALLICLPATESACGLPKPRLQPQTCTSPFAPNFIEREVECELIKSAAVWCYICIYKNKYSCSLHLWYKQIHSRYIYMYILVKLLPSTWFLPRDNFPLPITRDSQQLWGCQVFSVDCAL